MKKRVLVAVIIVAATAAAAYTLHMLDMMVYDTFRSYGLQFNYEWANPYWNLLRIIWVLLYIIAAATIVSTILSIRPLLRHASERKLKSTASLASNKMEKRPIQTRATEETQVPFTSPSLPRASATAQPLQTAQSSVSKPVSTPISITTSPSPQPPAGLTGLFRCGHCGKEFTQPLRMLDFRGDRPHMVEICPFCNEALHSTSRVAQ